ncbi:hypothetical protein NFX31_13895 [Microbacterium azadirachtae]|uniref:hypothetical protein n=1 Tax=Microbacterium azadirachtae TaxID=582680 RepID=UPI0021D50E89|nr:hypothetical protein [Microbacterium azadirachtae]UXW85294.1 hypothetical protein NFX31_13895 [Microbacterium azadirachtae]
MLSTAAAERIRLSTVLRTSAHAMPSASPMSAPRRRFSLRFGELGALGRTAVSPGTSATTAAPAGSPSAGAAAPPSVSTCPLSSFWTSTARARIQAFARSCACCGVAAWAVIRSVTVSSGTDAEIWLTSVCGVVLRSSWPITACAIVRFLAIST